MRRPEAVTHFLKNRCEESLFRSRRARRLIWNGGFRCHVRRLEAGIAADVHPVFGEVFSVVNRLI
jgi:hypothetical protein